MSFGKNLQFLRKMSNKMTQEELASRLGVLSQTVSRWEREKGFPDISLIGSLLIYSLILQLENSPGSLFLEKTCPQQ